jgi:hypothetical protein
MGFAIPSVTFAISKMMLKRQKLIKSRLTCSHITFFNYRDYLLAQISQTIFYMPDGICNPVRNVCDFKNDAKKTEANKIKVDV